MPPLLSAALGAILRHVLTLAAGLLVARGIWTDGEATEYVLGATLAILAFGWSYWQKQHTEVRIDTALDMPSGSSRELLNLRVKAGDYSGGRFVSVILALVIVSSLGPACAAKGLRNQTRVTALAVGDSVVALDEVEAVLFKANVYDKATHDRIGDGVLKLARAARAFERGAASWQDGPAPVTIASLRLGVLAALTDVEQLVPEAHRARFAAALAAIRAAVGAVSARIRLPLEPVKAAGLPAGGIMGLLSLIQLISKLLQERRLTFVKLWHFLKAEGATDEELAACDAALTDVILRREAEAAAGG